MIRSYLARYGRYERNFVTPSRPSRIATTMAGFGQAIRRAGTNPLVESLTGFDIYQASSGEIHTSPEKLFQGPIADALTDEAGVPSAIKTLQCWSSARPLYNEGVYEPRSIRCRRKERPASTWRAAAKPRDRRRSSEAAA